MLNACMACSCLFTEKSKCSKYDEFDLRQIEQLKGETIQSAP